MSFCASHSFEKDKKKFSYSARSTHIWSLDHVGETNGSTNPKPPG